MNAFENTKITIIGNGYLVEINKKYATKLADYLIENMIPVYEIRYPIDDENAKVYGKIYTDRDIDSIVKNFISLWN